MGQPGPEEDPDEGVGKFYLIFRFKAERASQKEFLSRFGFLKLCLGATLFLSLFLLVISFLAYSELHFKLFLATGLFAMFLSFVWLLGIIAIFR